MIKGLLILILLAVVGFFIVKKVWGWEGVITVTKTAITKILGFIGRGLGIIR